MVNEKEPYFPQSIDGMPEQVSDWNVEKMSLIVDHRSAVFSILIIGKHVHRPVTVPVKVEFFP